MSSNDSNTSERQQTSGKTEEQRPDDEQFWAEWWREYAQTWK